MIFNRQPDEGNNKSLMRPAGESRTQISAIRNLCSRAQPAPAHWCVLLPFFRRLLLQQITSTATASIDFCAYTPYSQTDLKANPSPVSDLPKAEPYHAIFREVMYAFHENSAIAGCLHAASIKDKKEVGHASHLPNKWMVKATLSDYVCDVVLCLRPRFAPCLDSECPKPECASCEDRLTPRLTVKEFAHFKSTYVDTDTDGHSLPLDTFDAKVRQKAVARFISCGVYPLSRYFRAVDIRIGKFDAPVIEVQNVA